MPSSDPVVEAQGAPEKKDTAKNTQKAEKASDKGTAGKPPNPPAAGGALTGAELKAQKKAEKAARRAQEAQARQAPSTLPPSAGQGATSTATSAGNASNSQHGNKGAKPESGGGQHKRNASQANVVSKGSHTNGTEVPAVEDKTVELFRHLYKPKSTTIANAAKEVHPAVLALGVQMSSYTICGSIARLVATLQAFKRVRALFSQDVGGEPKLMVLGHRIIYNTTWKHSSETFHTTRTVTAN
jgi:translation initiation factor eIF-2B subunit delta